MPSRKVSVQRGFLVSLAGAVGLFLVIVVVSGAAWRAAAYMIIALFAFLIVLAAYFWGSVMFGGFLEFALARRNAVPWSLGANGLDAPEYDLDPGLELLAAGMLVYRFGEVKPRIHFRKVPLINARAVRPFVVARTGSERPYPFEFTLTSEYEQVQFEEQFSYQVQAVPQMIMPDCLLRIESPRRLVGQRWNLRVRSGVTVVTSFRFMFVEGAETSLSPRQDTGERILDWQEDFLPVLLDEAIKHDALTRTREQVLEDY